MRERLAEAFRVGDRTVKAGAERERADHPDHAGDRADERGANRDPDLPAAGLEREAGAEHRRDTEAGARGCGCDLARRSCVASRARSPRSLRNTPSVAAQLTAPLFAPGRSFAPNGVRGRPREMEEGGRASTRGTRSAQGGGRRFRYQSIRIARRLGSPPAPIRAMARWRSDFSLRARARPAAGSTRR